MAGIDAAMMVTETSAVSKVVRVAASSVEGSDQNMSLLGSEGGRMIVLTGVL